MKSLIQLVNLAHILLKRSNMPQEPVRVVIIGGGVIGLTTGIVLQLHGFRTKIYTKHWVNKAHPYDLSKRPPELASIHAAASIIPHSVAHPNENEILEISQKFFHRLAFSANFGVRIQRHYELHEFKPTPPEYARKVKGLSMLSGDGYSWLNDPNIPRRKGAPGIWGWHFNSFFAEVPTYMQQLYKLYEVSGGEIHFREIFGLEELDENINGDAVVNCTGRWAMDLFPEDKKNTQIVRGHMVKVNIYEVPHDQRGQYFSYNYSPDPSSNIYSRIDPVSGQNSNADVYFYPRSDGWLLGGSRQVGYPEIGEDWREIDEQISPSVSKMKKSGWKYEIPAPIWELNRELIYDITTPKIDIDNPKYSSFSYVGYRFKRNRIRIEADTKNVLVSKKLYHNYGHGGGGYTLSWGSAYEILKCLENDFETASFTKFKPLLNTEEGNELSLLGILQDLAKHLFMERHKDQILE